MDGLGIHEYDKPNEPLSYYINGIITNNMNNLTTDDLIYNQVDSNTANNVNRVADSKIVNNVDQVDPDPINNHINNSNDGDDINETNIQCSQKCPLCNNWLLGDQEIKKYKGSEKQFIGWDCHEKCINITN